MASWAGSLGFMYCTVCLLWVWTMAGIAWLVSYLPSFMRCSIFWKTIPPTPDFFFKLPFAAAFRKLTATVYSQNGCCHKFIYSWSSPCSELRPPHTCNPFLKGALYVDNKNPEQINFQHHIQGLTCPSVLLTCSVGNSILLEDKHQGLRPELDKTGPDLTHHMHKSQHPSPAVRNLATLSNLLFIVTKKRHMEGQNT